MQSTKKNIMKNEDYLYMHCYKLQFGQIHSNNAMMVMMMISKSLVKIISW